jgi:hypothetical protein
MYNTPTLAQVETNGPPLSIFLCSVVLTNEGWLLAPLSRIELPLQIILKLGIIQDHLDLLEHSTVRQIKIISNIIWPKLHYFV